MVDRVMAGAMDAKRHMTIMALARGAALWPVLMLAETFHGILRVTFLAPVVGDLTARQIAVFSGMLIILAVAFAAVPWIGTRRSRVLLLVGAIWVGLTVPFEIIIGRATGASWERIWSDYDLSAGGLMPLGLAFMLFAPLLASSLRGRR